MANLSDLAQAPNPAMLGGGLARMAGNKLLLRKQYQDYVTNASESGEEVKTFDEWAKVQTNG